MSASSAISGSPGELGPEEQILRKVWELSPLAIIVTDPSGDIEYVNPMFEEITGYSAGEVVGRNPRILKSGSQGPEVYADLWRTITSGGIWAGRLQNRRKDGALYWESLTISPIFDDEKKILHFVALKKNVTAEEELQLASNQLYALTLEAVNDAVWDWNLATKTAFFSPKYYSMLGYEVGEFPATYESWRALVHPEDIDRVEEELLRNMESGKGTSADIRMKSKSGEWIWISTRGNVVEHDAQGKPLRMLGTHTDITHRKRAEEAMLKSNEEFTAMFELASIGMAQCDPQTGQWLRVNRKMCQITGYTAAELLEMNVPEITHPEDREVDFEKFQSVVRGELPAYRLEKRYVRKDGTVVWVSVNMTVIRDAAGKPLRTMAAIEDLTDRKRAEEERELAFGRLSLATKAGGVGVWDYDIVSNKLVWDEQMFSLYGITRESFPGAYEAWKAGIHPEDVQRKDQELQMAISGEKDFDTEFRVIWPDGSIHVIRALAIVQRSPSGEPLRMIGTNWDITVRKRMEEALQLSERRMKELLASVTDYIYTVRFQNGTVGSTEHGPGCLSVTGYSSEDYANDPYLWYRVVHPDDRPTVVSIAAKMTSGEVGPPLEHRIFHRDGSVRWVRNQRVFRHTPDGRIAGYDGLISDITDRKIAEEALRKALTNLQESHEELKASQMLLINTEKLEITGRLAAGVAHEVKNPLAILAMSLDYLSRALPDRNENVSSVLEDMRAAIRRADRIIIGLLDFSASEKLELQPGDLNSVIEQALLLANHSRKSNRVELVKNLACDLPPVSIDQNKAVQALVNIFSNAIDAMPDGGLLTVSSHHQPSNTSGQFPGEGAMVVIEIEDTGSGISPDKLSKIFDPFFTTKLPGKGTGLGLTVTRKIIELHGGRLQITNKPEGGVLTSLLFPALKAK